MAVHTCPSSWDRGIRSLRSYLATQRIWDQAGLHKTCPQHTQENLAGPHCPPISTLVLCPLCCRTTLIEPPIFTVFSPVLSEDYFCGFLALSCLLKWSLKCHTDFHIANPVNVSHPLQCTNSTQCGWLSSLSWPVSSVDTRGVRLSDLIFCGLSSAHPLEPAHQPISGFLPALLANPGSPAPLQGPPTPWPFHSLLVSWLQTPSWRFYFHTWVDDCLSISTWKSDNVKFTV